MNKNKTYQNTVGVLALIAGLLALVSLVIGLIAVSWDFEMFEHASVLIATGPTAAGLIRWSYWLNMLGNYLLLIPLALFLYRWLGSANSGLIQLFTASGILYMVLGAMGSAIFAAAWPYLIETYATSAADYQEILISNFEMITKIAGEGFHGVLQDLVGATWFLGIGYFLRSKLKGLGIFGMVVGLFVALNTIGLLLNIEAISLIGLTANILLGPLWSICMGVILIRSEATSFS